MEVSPNTKAILMLTAPLIVGRERSSVDLLTQSEYNRLARILSENQREPADLLRPEVVEPGSQLQSTIDAARLENLLKRGFLLSQAIERWQTRSIWVVSRADKDYPRKLKERLKDAAPILLYGCGDNTLLETGGLAIVGSRNVDENLIQYTEKIGRQAARYNITVVSGGAKGIDRAAMFGALQAGGRVIGVLSDSLERMCLARENREYLMGKKLVLISPYDPLAGFDVGNAMQRNKSIYALADAALVVHSDYEKGGTWAGAKEQLEKLRLVPVFVRNSEDKVKGLTALRQKGAELWPNPETSEEFTNVLSAPISSPKKDLIQKELPLIAIESSAQNNIQPEHVHESPPAWTEHKTDESSRMTFTPAAELFSKVQEIILKMNLPKTEAEIAEDIQVSKSQAREWLNRLVDEGKLKKKRGQGYIVASEKQEKLLKNI